MAYTRWLEKRCIYNQKAAIKTKKDASKVAPKIVNELETNSELTESRSCSASFIYSDSMQLGLYQQAHGTN